MQFIRSQRTASIKYKDGHYGVLTFAMNELAELEAIMDSDIDSIEDVTIYGMFDVPILMHRPVMSRNQ